jgi:hypothetical protein
MDKATASLGQSQPGAAVPQQKEALQSLYEAQREIAQAMAAALGAEEPMQWLEQMGQLDEIIGQIQDMANTAEAMPPAPAPAMAQQASNIGQQLSQMSGAPPMGPAMGAQMQDAGQMMDAASGQLTEGQTGQAAQTMNQAAQALQGTRGQMAAQMAAGLAQAQQAAAQAMAQGQPGQAAAMAAAAQAAAQAMAQGMGQQGMQPSSRPGRGGRGMGMRGLGPTDYDPASDIEVDLESGAWARLPEREREEILQALKEKYPARYERALIRYFRNLSRLEDER